MKTYKKKLPLTSGLARPLSKAVMAVWCLTWMLGPLRGQINIDLPEITLLPDRANQSFSVFLGEFAGTVPVNGVSFNIQVADGGPEAGGIIAGPAITSVDIFAGTVFELSNNGPSGSGQIVPQIFERGTMTDPNKLPTVSLESGVKLATVTLDTTGIGAGVFVLSLKTLNGSTKFTTLDEDLYPIVIDGSVTVVPEPCVWGLAGGLALMVFAGARTARNRQRSRV